MGLGTLAHQRRLRAAKKVALAAEKPAPAEAPSAPAPQVEPARPAPQGQRHNGRR